MRKLLILALLLYNIVANQTSASSYDYDDMDPNKRHSLIDDRRNWRKKALLKPLEEHKDWDRRRHDYDGPRYMDEQEPKIFGGIDRDRQRDMDLSAPYRQGSRPHYEEEIKINMQQGMKSAESVHQGPRESYMEKEPVDKKLPMAMTCERPHERYEACFAGCASVTCDNPRDRLRPCYPFCEPGCICVHPYVRDDRTHKCVLPEDCTKGLKGIPDLGDDI